VHPRTRSAPQPEEESILGHFLPGGLDLVVYLDRLLRATTKKRSSAFSMNKVHPPDKVLATPMLACLIPVTLIGLEYYIHCRM